MEKIRKQNVMGWISYSFSLFLTCVWAFWGIIENFHEGWYHESFIQNIGLLFLQYLSPMFLFLFLTLISVWKQRVGALLFLLVGIGLSFWFNKFNFFVLLPFFLLASLFWFGQISNKKQKYKVTVILPLFILIIFSVEPVYRVSTRYNDGNFGMRVIKSNGVSLIWAPEGPGWPDDGVNWYEADSLCKYLTEDGLSIATTQQNIWRLPTVEEAVRSMHRHGINCMGRLNASGTPEYENEPDKETPLWNPHTMVIYWWTGTEIDSTHASIITYNGKIRKREKKYGPGSLGFRAVKKFQKGNK
ncbi:MAG TPA: DUF1566 domain-containing protein [Calditrichaeota bacterium]|nr:DUF1566 domain-containing protein [Calditrichota bacterium]